MVPQIRFEGGKELAASLASLSTRVSRKIQLEALGDGAEPMRLSMEARAPLDSGHPGLHLKTNMTKSPARGADIQEVALAVGPAKGTFWGSFQEFGTAHHQAQPFARPAFDTTHLAALAIIARELWIALAGRRIFPPMVQRSGPVLAGPGGFRGVGGNSGSLT